MTFCFHHKGGGVVIVNTMNHLGEGFDYFFNDMSLGSSSKSTLEDRGDPNDPRVRLKRDCVGIMAAFRLKDTLHHVIVANTHIYW